MAEEQSKEPSSNKPSENCPEFLDTSQFWCPGPYTSYYAMAGYPQKYVLATCPFHMPLAGQQFTPVYGCPYCVTIQQPQQIQNININIGGGIVPSGNNSQYYQASLLGAKFSGFPDVLPTVNNGPAWGWSQYQTTLPGQTRVQQEAFIHARSDNRPQDMQPSDPDPWRFYTVKELDGGTTSRNRYTIDSGEIGKIRWYQTPQGVFYAVVIPDSKA